MSLRKSFLSRSLTEAWRPFFVAGECITSHDRLTAGWPVVASRFLHTALILQIRTDQRGDICLCAHIRDTADAMLDRRGIIVSGYVANL